MSDGVIAIDRDSTIKEAAREMRDENIRSLVVLEDGEAVGILVGRDMVYEIVAEGKDPGEALVEDAMTSDLVTAAEDDSIEEIARAMLEHDISRVPVLRGDSLVGIVTQSNLVRTWPSYLDLLEEESHAYSDESVGEVNPAGSQAGTCDSCGNYSEDLQGANGELLCPECRDAGLL